LFFVVGLIGVADLSYSGFYDYSFYFWEFVVVAVGLPVLKVLAMSILLSMF